MVDELVLSQPDQPQIYHLVHQMAQAGVIQIPIFMVILVESVLRDACQRTN